ncbi:hypothetical protein SAMN06265379_101301 [Saccharicrinis carchari]|uniref:Uncharacterized protein n=1 Tax=Saccharicrinis carchari TaxID=1168039 RepID=A0A521APV3_SACCC|nr:hypothetical protein [Saccharicrinis carchari]SMO36670.1 hypothetical protein SAMN06265379_101301 [Saccharicrinis carchari]
MDISEKRPESKDGSCMVPRPVEGKKGLVEVDTTWDKILRLTYYSKMSFVSLNKLNN